MAAISANLLAATVPSPNRLANLASQTTTGSQPTIVSGFADVLTQATTPATTTTGTQPTTEAEPSEPEAGGEIATSLAALGLVVQPQPTPLPTVVPTATGAGTPAGLTDGLRASTPTPATPATSIPPETTSRSAEVLRKTTSNQTFTTSLQRTADTRLTDTPAESQQATVANEPLIPTTPPLTPVAATPGEVAQAAARPQAVAPQMPVVVEKSQQLPTQPAEIGYGLVGPTVAGTPAVNPVSAVGGTPSQAQVEQLPARVPAAEVSPRSTAADVSPRSAAAAGTPLPVTPSQPVAQFQDVLSAEASPAVTVQSDMPTGTVAVPPTTDVVTTPAGETRASQAVRLPPAAERLAEQTFFAAPQPAVVTAPTPTTEPIDVSTVGEQNTPQATTAQPPATPSAEPTPTAPPRLAPNAPPAAAQLSEAYVTHARVIQSGGNHEFQLRLDPPELGEVKVRVVAMGDRVEATLVVSDDAVKRLIESQLPELRQRLEAAGVSVPSFDVSTGGNANTGGDGWDRSQPAFAPTPKPAGPPPRPVPRPLAAGGLVDVTA